MSITLNPLTHVKIIRDTLEEERRRASFALRNYPSSRDRKIAAINIALDSLNELEEVVSSKEIQNAAAERNKTEQREAI